MNSKRLKQENSEKRIIINKNHQSFVENNKNYRLASLDLKKYPSFWNDVNSREKDDDSFSQTRTKSVRKFKKFKVSVKALSKLNQKIENISKPLSPNPFNLKFRRNFSKKTISQAPTMRNIQNPIHQSKNCFLNHNSSKINILQVNHNKKPKKKSKKTMNDLLSSYKPHSDFLYSFSLENGVLRSVSYY